MEYRFEQRQFLRFQLYDVASETAPISDDDTIAFAECTVGKIVYAGPKGHSQPLECVYKDNSNPNGLAGSTILLIAGELKTCNDEVLIHLCGSDMGGLTSCCLNVKSFFDVSKKNDLGNFSVTQRCEEVRGNNPVWPPLAIHARTLCSGDYNQALKIQVWKKSIVSKYELIGFCMTTVNQMVLKEHDRMTLQSPTGNIIETTISVIICSTKPQY